jgi:hypothetical protein
MIITTLLLLAAIGNELTVPKTTLTSTNISDALSFVFALLGVIAVIIIILGGFQYITSQGEPQKTAKAKDTILYAVIGLVVSILAWSIVNFVLDRV